MLKPLVAAASFLFLAEPALADRSSREAHHGRPDRDDRGKSSRDRDDRGKPDWARHSYRDHDNGRRAYYARQRDSGSWGSWSSASRYGANSWDARYPERYYVADNRYKTRRLASNDRVYRGYDGRYYCRRDDGTTGLILGALAGGSLGAVIAPGQSKTIAGLLGGGIGAVIGKALDDGVECR